jgi:hypothetical protein
MSVLDTGGAFRILTDCWFPPFLNGAMGAMSSKQIADTATWINRYVLDEAVAQPKGMNVTAALRLFAPNHPHWTGTPLQPLYDNTWWDEVHAARLYGNLVCRIAIGRPETFWCFIAPVAEDRYSRTYVLDRNVPR